MTRAITETVKLYRFEPGTEDVHGNHPGGFADPVEVGIWRFSPGTASDPFTPGHTRTVTQPTIFGPTPMGPRDEVEVRGIRYPVDGDHLEWRSGRVHGYEIPLRRIDG